MLYLYTSSILSNTIAEIFAATSSTGIIKDSQYRQLVAALNESLEDRDRKAIERVLRFVSRGRIQVVDDLPQTAIAA